MNGPTLRPYQNEAKKAVRDAYVAGQRRVGVSLPTGTGKTVIFSSMARDTYDKGNRVIVLVHRDTLVEQAVDKLSRVIPAADIGVVKASQNDVNARVIVASVHTLRKPERLRQIIPPDLTVVDEAHVSVAPTYHEYYRHVDAVPGGRGYLAGFTATWMRNDSRGLGDIWQDVVYKRSIKWAVRNGYLVPPRAMQLGGNLDLSGVRINNNPDSEGYGDYNERDLADVVMVEDLLNTVIAGYQRFAPGRPAVLFAPTQASARYFLDGFTKAGVPVAEIFASTSKSQRKWAFAAYENSQTQILGTCTALAEGWDCPRCAVAIMLRPTKSMLMFIQQIGRILRPWVGKPEGLVLDFVGVTDDKDMRSIVDLRESREAVEGEIEDDDEDIENDDYERVPIPHTAKKIDGVTQVDLFAGTNARWLHTNRGVPFIQTKQHTYFVALHNGSWAVGRCAARSRAGGAWLHTGLESAEALELGSEIALAEDPSLTDKRASWRKSGAPSPQQLDYARKLNIAVNGESKAELSDLIAIKVASGLLAGIGV